MTERKIPKYQRSSIVLYTLLSICLLLYSYTQVDLGLTVTRIGWVRNLQENFQYIGYFRRDISTVLYICILTLAFTLYAMTIGNIQKGRMTKTTVRQIVVILAVILVFSYPAFSHDLFNYMFTAKTVVVYHKNPYEIVPMQFADVDPWLGFMRWTHLPSAYTPLWILLTLPFYILGFRVFLLTLWSFKLIGAAAYVATTYLLYRSLLIVKPEKALLGAAIFATNPLVIIEALVSAHNDIVMMALAVFAYYLVLKKDKFISYSVLAVSVALKLMTACLLPCYVFSWRRGCMLVFMGIGFVSVLLVREVLPWYFLWILPFIALLAENRPLTILGFSASLGLLLRYAPYLYYGHWDNPVPILKTWGTALPLIFGCIAVYVYKAKIRRTF